MADLEHSEGVARARSNDHARAGRVIKAGDTLMGTTTGSRVMADKLLVRMLYVIRKNRHETLSEFCCRVDSHPNFIGNAWANATRNVTGEAVTLQDIGAEDLRRVCVFLAHAIRTTPTQTDDAPWYPDGWRAAMDAFPGRTQQ